MVGWHHWLNGQEFEQTPGDEERQGSLSLVQFSRSVVSDSLRPYESQHARPPCPSPTKTHAHRVSDAIQPSHPLSSPSPPAPNPSQHQSLFQRVHSSHEVAKVLEFQLQHHSFQRNPGANLLQNGLVGSPCSPRDSHESSPTPQFKSIDSSALSLLHSPTLTSIAYLCLNLCHRICTGGTRSKESTNLISIREGRTPGHPIFMYGQYS